MINTYKETQYFILMKELYFVIYKTLSFLFVN